jgi:DNA-binding CsgD family transcriptional regulator
MVQTMQTMQTALAAQTGNNVQTINTAQSVRTDTVFRLADADLTAILGSTDWDQLRKRVLSLLSKAGIQDFLLRMDVGVANGTTCSHMFGSLPAATLKLFDTHLQSQDDPVNRHCARSCLPMEWDVATLCEEGSGRAYPVLYADGVRHGASLAVRGALAMSRIDFYRHANHCLPLSTAQKADLALLGAYMHEAVHRLWNAQNAHPVPTLTEREQECLYWSAGGKTGKETAMILGISQHTVYFHLRNVASKFNVYSTRHAITRATFMGMIKPQLA